MFCRFDDHRKSIITLALPKTAVRYSVNRAHDLQCGACLPRELSLVCVECNVVVHLIANLLQRSRHLLARVGTKHRSLTAEFPGDAALIHTDTLTQTDSIVTTNSTYTRAKDAVICLSKC